MPVCLFTRARDLWTGWCRTEGGERPGQKPEAIFGTTSSFFSRYRFKLSYNMGGADLKVNENECHEFLELY